MADVIATLVARLEADVAGFKKDLAGATGRIDALDGSTRKASTTFGGLRKAALLVGSALAVAKIGQFAKDSLQMAVNAEEAASAFNTTFGPAVGGVSEFVDEFANKAGFATFELQQLLATSGNVVQGLGATEAESATLAQSMATLAGDVASFSNAAGGAPAVLAALQSALTGEREALKTYGIVVTESEVQQRALNDTQKQSIKELTQLDKANATVAIAYEKAGKAVGDLDRTQDSSANTMRQLSAMWKEAQVQLGQALLPALKKLLPALKDMVPVIGDLLVNLGGIAATVGESVIPVLKLVVPVLGAASKAVEDFFDPFASAVDKRLVARISTEFDNLAASLAAGKSGLQETANLLQLGAVQGKLNAETIAEWTKKYDISADSLQFVIDHLSDLGVEQKYVKKITEEASKAIGINEQALEDARQAQGLLTADTIMAARASKDYKTIVRDESYSHRDNEKAIRDERQAILDNTKAKLEAVNPTLQLMDAQDRLRDANQKLVDLEIDGKRATDEYAQAQRDLIRAQAELEGASAQFNLASAGSVDAFRRLAAAAGLSRDEIDKLLNSIGVLNTTPVRVPAQGGGGFFGGGVQRAAGGPVMASRPYVVGEKGPELFVPNNAGFIVPNGAGGGIGSVTINVSGAGDPRAVAEEVRRVLAKVMARNGSVGVG